MRSVLVAGLAMVLACGRGGERATPPAPVHTPDGSGTAPGSAGSSGSAMSTSSVTIGASVTATRPGRPPLQRLVVDVTIANAGDAPRWILIPKQVPPNPDAEGGGVDGLDLRGAGAALLGTFRGVGGTHALRVAARARVTIVELEIGWWRSSPGDTVPPLVVTVADDLTIGGQPARAWFGAEPLVPDGARLDAAAGAIGAHAVDGDEVALALVGATTTTATLSLPNAAP